MEPDILASPGPEAASGPDWPTPVNHPARDSHTLDATPQTGQARPSLSAGAPAAGGERPRLATGTTTHPHGFANGHARPRTTARGAWANGGHGSSAVTLTPAIPFETPEPRGLYLRHGKRLLDIVGALVALVFFLPVIAVLAVLIKLESRGPVFYRSTRIGRGGRAFTFLKLRSMVKDADRRKHQLKHLNESDGPVFKMARDPRITRIGRFIRTSSLDELPQFFNVLLGDMSLVGPRPPIPEEVAQYEPWQLRRLDVRPGITCLWQISGRSRIGFQEWMRLDLEYIKHQSLALDLKILLRTIPAVLSREGAY